MIFQTCNTDTITTENLSHFCCFFFKFQTHKKFDTFLRTFWLCHMLFCCVSAGMRRESGTTQNRNEKPFPKFPFRKSLAVLIGEVALVETKKKTVTHRLVFEMPRLRLLCQVGVNTHKSMENHQHQHHDLQSLRHQPPTNLWCLGDHTCFCPVGVNTRQIMETRKKNTSGEQEQHVWSQRAANTTDWICC